MRPSLFAALLPPVFPAPTDFDRRVTTRLGFILVALLLMTGVKARAADTETVMHSFALTSNDGSSVYSSLTMDASGNFYGTTVDGGAHAAGVVFRLSPTSGGRWQETVLYAFTGGVDGGNPHAAVVFDTAGNLYGTTEAGGVKQKGCGTGCGVVFELMPSETGSWTETVLHAFKGSDGSTPYAGVVLDAAGNLYGATLAGGKSGAGTVYKLSQNGGVWSETVLHNFTGQPDGKTPYATPILDDSGNLYGTTYTGGAHNQGSVYEISTQPSVTESVLYSFKGGTDGDEPFAGVIFDHNGNLYGTTSEGGTANYGTAYRLNAAKGWNKTILHQFLGLSVGDGGYPNGLIFDGSNTLYGTTVGGGQYNPGTIFRITLGSGGSKETVLYSFTGGNDGAYPSASLTLDSGTLYGTTLWGGPAGDTVGGVAFQFVP
jgi:uncharacterized repeat protein (TIGR03803 family)